MNTIKQHIKENKLKRVYLLYGSESYLKRLYKNKLRSAIQDLDDTMNYSYFEGKEIDMNMVIPISDTLPFFSERRLIVIENSGWFKSANTFADYLKISPESTFFIFIESDVDKRNKLFKEVKEIGYACEMNGLDENNLKLWIGSMLMQQNKKIKDSTTSFLLQYVGSNMDRLECEIEKLTAYCLEKEEVTVNDIKAICSEQITGKIFLMLDAIAAKDRKQALSLYYDLITLREKPLSILFLLNRHMNQLLLTKDMLGNHMDYTTIASKLGVPTFAVTKYSRQSASFSSQVLIAALTIGAQIEEAIKSGNLNEQIGVELMIVQSTLL